MKMADQPNCSTGSCGKGPSSGCLVAGTLAAATVISGLGLRSSEKPEIRLLGDAVLDFGSKLVDLAFTLCRR